MTIAAVMAASAPAWFNQIRFTPSSSFCITNPRNDRAAKRQRAAAKRRNKAKRG
ncbi:hypothetical protein HQ397_04070 [Aeromonas hydrophila]|uniref:hypothetical protein n=1 Tax=Aeromonas hydrophila TaxID=644 RepID=UPI001C779EB6|nr:hypothetical protein [Aeromonas hydrophila]QWL69384.1 hypothetical protein HQ397_04070 [Aeromonas hydrophila]